MQLTHNLPAAGATYRVGYLLVHPRGQRWFAGLRLPIDAQWIVQLSAGEWHTHATLHAAYQQLSHFNGIGLFRVRWSARTSQKRCLLIDDAAVIPPQDRDALKMNRVTNLPRFR